VPGLTSIKGNLMKKTLLLTVALALASPTFAGGPVITTEEPEIRAEEPSSVGILPLLLVGVVLCVALCGGGSDERRTPEPEPEPEPCGKTVTEC
jgi:hypothetical protein